MKRIALLFMAAAVLAACQKEKENVAEPAAPGTYTYTIKAGHGETRTDYDAEGTFTWTAGDQISVLFNNGTQNKFFTLTAAAPGATAVFSGEIEEGYTIGAADGTENDKKIWALYPASDQHTYVKPENEDAVVSFYVQPSADFTQTGFSANIPMYDLVAKEGSLSFKNLASTYKFIVKGLDPSIQNVKFTVYNQTTYALSGSWPIHAGEIYINYAYASPGSANSTLTYVNEAVNGEAVFYVSCCYWGKFQPHISIADADRDYVIQEFVATNELKPTSLTQVQPVAITVTAALPTVMVDGVIEEWDNKPVGTGSNNRILEWKYASDENNVYFLYKVDKSKIKLSTTSETPSFDWDAYIYVAFDNDQNAATPSASVNAGSGMTGGYEARAAIFPWRGNVEGSPECYKGIETNGDISCPVGTETGKVTVAGSFDGDYCYVEVCIPRNLIGNPTGTINVNHSMNWYTTGDAPITLAGPAEAKEAVITAEDVTVKVGKNKAIGATTNSSAAIEYVSGNTAVATVSSDGTVTGVAEGSTTITLSVPAVEGYYTAATKTINVTVEAASAAVIEIDGDMSDWDKFTLIPSEGNGAGRIRSWKIAGDSDNIYLYLVLRKNRMYSTQPIYIGFDWDETGAYHANNLSGCELLITTTPFTNSDSGSQPVSVQGFDTDASINGTVVADAVFAWDYDNGSSLSSSSSDHFLEISIPRSKLPSLPASGTTVKMGIDIEWYFSDMLSITLP